MYKFEIHLHTNNCSGCAVSSPEEMIDAAAEKGYSGIVLTNHFYRGNTCVDRKLPWKEFVEAYVQDYKIALAYGKAKGIAVFFGLEEVYAPGREMLIYGLDPKKLIATPEFIHMDLKEMSLFVRENGGVCICAHPFRSRMYIPEPDAVTSPEYFDGVEGFNLCNQPEENEKAFVFGLNNKKIITSGGDVHNAADFGNSGIAFESPVKNYKDFLKRLKKGDFKLITPLENCGD